MDIGVNLAPNIVYAICATVIIINVVDSIRRIVTNKNK